MSKPMTPKEILDTLEHLTPEQQAIFIQLQLDVANLNGRLEGINEMNRRMDDIKSEVL